MPPPLQGGIEMLKSGIDLLYVVFESSSPSPSYSSSTIDLENGKCSVGDNLFGCT